MPTINVKLSHTAYPVVIGAGQAAKLPSLVRKYARGDKLFVVVDAQVYALHGQRLLKALEQHGREVIPFVLPQGEAAKTQRVVDGLYEFLLSNKISRADFILACGGGVTTDVAGFTAATILRGVTWGAVPTTLLGMVDAAVGGKTGINHPLGKNLIGAIWQPEFVSCDLNFLQTLPRRQLIAGCGELLKYGGLIGEPMLALLQKYVNQSDLLHATLLPKLIRIGVEYKAAIVMYDEQERNVRTLLNLGHTFGHALEHVRGYGKILHGEAVIIGLLGAISLSEQVVPRSIQHLAKYKELVTTAAALLPAARVPAPAVSQAMTLDKKRSLGALRFVLLERPGKPYIAIDPPTRQVSHAVEEMLAVYTKQGGRHVTHPGR